MKKSLVITYVFLHFMSCESQEQESAYLFFDSTNEEKFTKFNDGQEYEEKKYRELFQSNLYIDFYILDDFFRFDLKKHDSTKFNKSEIKKIKFTSIDKMNRKWKKSELFSKNGVYKKVYIVKQSSKNDIYICYPVDWIEYQE